MNNIFSRLEIAIGTENLELLKNKKVIVFGIGGVGSYCVETLVRSGISNITLVDPDVYSITNINRQLYATLDTVDKSKVEVARERIKNINKDCIVRAIQKKLFKNVEEFNLKEYDYVIDCIDTITSKIELMKYCRRNKIKIISSMGFGNKFSPELIKISKLKNTKSCKLARAIKKLTKNDKLDNIDVVYTTEINHNPKYIVGDTEKEADNTTNIRKLAPASNSFVPPVAGIIITSFVIRKLLGYKIHYDI